MIEAQVEVASITDAKPLEVYREEGDRLVRIVRRRDGSARHSSVPKRDGLPKRASLAEAFDWSWLRAEQRPRVASGDEQVRIADLFSGGGLMTLGAVEAFRALGVRATPAMLLDMDKSAAAACARNFPDAETLTSRVEEIVDGDLGSKPTKTERELLAKLESIHVLLGGPPCQGHSDLNNHTRRVDDRNELAIRMARFCELFEPEIVVLENVRGILHDSRNVLARVEAHLKTLGYKTEIAIAKAERIGVAQRRHRVFLVGNKSRACAFAETLRALEVPARGFGWACSDLIDRNHVPFDTATTPSATNVGRIEYLFEHELHELPDDQRPDCHRNGGHSYKSVYGRLWWDRPAQTITTGFRSMGQGRYVHPKRKRVITPHEAARLQFIPDFYDFGDASSGAVATLIGNAVPPKLAYAATLAAAR